MKSEKSLVQNVKTSEQGKQQKHKFSTKKGKRTRQSLELNSNL